METLYFAIGLILGPTIFYLGFWTGRKTGYEDKNVPPPPNPLAPKVPVLFSAPIKKENPQGWVTDDEPDPPMANFNPRAEL